MFPILIEVQAMKTSVIEVHDLLAVLSLEEVEKRIGEVPGAQSVTVNFAAGNATVRYDETRLDLAHLKSIMRQRGYDGAAVPPGDGHDNHMTPGPQAATSAEKSERAPVAAAGDEPPSQGKPAIDPAAAGPKPAPNSPPAAEGQKAKAAPEKS